MICKFFIIIISNYDVCEGLVGSGDNGLQYEIRHYAN
jgi:hypothetical protein